MTKVKTEKPEKNPLENSVVPCAYSMRYKGINELIRMATSIYSISIDHKKQQSTG